MERIPYGKHSKEFRQEAVKLVIEGGLSIHEAGRRLSLKGVNIQDESIWENLMNQLTRAYDEYEGGDNEDVKDDLRTFINKLESGSREKIGQQDTDMLIQFANEIMARL